MVSGKSKVNKLSADEQVWWDRNGAKINLKKMLENIKQKKTTGSKRSADQKAEEMPKAKCVKTG